MANHIYWQWPKRWLNRLICYVGFFGLLFQFVAGLHAWMNDITLPYFWFFLLAPALCVVSGIFPPLQIQMETANRDHK